MIIINLIQLCSTLIFTSWNLLNYSVHTYRSLHGHSQLWLRLHLERHWSRLSRCTNIRSRYPLEPSFFFLRSSQKIDWLSAQWFNLRCEGWSTLIALLFVQVLHTLRTCIGTSVPGGCQLEIYCVHNCRVLLPLNFDRFGVVDSGEKARQQAGSVVYQS